MNIYQLEAFITLAQVLNYTKASQILHTTQPNLSKMIVNLEQEIGVQLLMRNKRDVHLTPAGRAYYEDVKNILAMHDKALIRAKHTQEGVEGIIDVGFLGTALPGYLPRIINRFRVAHPNIALNLVDYTFTTLIDAIKEEKIDVALTLDRELDNISKLEKKFIFSDCMCLVVHKDHPMAELASVHMNQLDAESFVMMDPKVSMLDFEMVSSMCQAHNFSPHVVTESNTLQNVMIMVECKVGVTILAKHMQQYASRYLRFVPIVGFENFFKIICAWRRGINPSVGKLIEVIDKCLAD